MQTFNHQSRWLFIIGSLIALSGHSHLASAESSDWFKSSYGALWEDKPWDNAAEIMAHYRESVTYYPDDGEPESLSRQAFIGDSLSEWQAEGWLSSVLAAHQSSRVNDSTVIHTTRWLDAYEDGSSESSCGWYLTSRSDDRWVIAAYADIACSDFGL